MKGLNGLDLKKDERFQGTAPPTDRMIHMLDCCQYRNMAPNLQRHSGCNQSERSGWMSAAELFSSDCSLHTFCIISGSITNTWPGEHCLCLKTTVTCRLHKTHVPSQENKVAEASVGYLELFPPGWTLCWVYTCGMWVPIPVGVCEEKHKPH